MIAAAALAAVLALAPPDAADRTLDAAGSKLHIHCEGVREPGAPLVVLEAGAGNTARTWNDVLGPIAQFARVCAYDRVNMGSSDSLDGPITGGRHAAMLHALLTAANEPPPYVLAGHSFGGMIVRLFASAHSAEVAGLVLVDSSHEDQIVRFGILPDPPPPPASALPPPQARRESIDLPGTAAELAKAPWHANIPLIVLSRGVWTTAPSGDSLAYARLGIWQDMHRELATRSPQGEVVVATKSGHYIQNDEPDIVVAAIRKALTAAKAGG